MDHSEAGKLGFLESKATREEKHRKFVEAYNNHPNKCRLCRASISFEKRRNDFCSHSCATTFSNNKRYKNPKCDITQPHPCAHCGVVISERRYRTYCSRDCYVKAKWIKFKLEVEATGEIKVSDDSSGRKLAKKYLIDVLGHQCEICKNVEWLSQPIPLILDHIDGNSENCKLDNLRLVCGNCNMQLPTFAGKNKGNGRVWRRQRYALGLSS